MTPRGAARETVLGRIRDALGPDPQAPSIPRDYKMTGDLDKAAVTRRFADRVGDYRAQVHRTSAEGVPATLAHILIACGAQRIGVPTGLPRTWLGDLPSTLEVVLDDPSLSSAVLDSLDVVITGSVVGIAETGTIVLDASPDQGRRALTLVPDHHICLVASDRIVHTVPEGLARLIPTRPLTLISGPSATSDIELDRVEGVHGPRSLEVVIIED